MTSATQLPDAAAPSPDHVTLPPPDATTEPFSNSLDEVTVPDVADHLIVTGTPAAEVHESAAADTQLAAGGGDVVTGAGGLVAGGFVTGAAVPDGGFAVV